MMSIGLWAQEAVFTHVIDAGTGYVSRVELPVQRRLCPIFVRNVGSPDIHECFRRLTGSQRTPGIWSVTQIQLESLARESVREDLNILRVCYNRLNHQEKNIFLGVARFFKGEYKDFVTKVLDR